MTCSMPHSKAVLTGDLIDSTRADRGAVEAALARIATLYGADYGFSRSRGDGWQILLPQLGQGLWVMVRIAADLRAQGGLESRIALGIGAVDHADLSDLSSASGEAFTASGRCLSGLSKDQRFGLAGAGVDPLHARLVAMIDERLQRWSVEQAEAAAHAMQSFPLRTQADIAEELGVSRQAVAARLAAAGFAQIAAATADFFTRFGNGEAWDG